MNKVNIGWSDIGTVETSQYMIDETIKNYPWIARKIEELGKTIRNEIGGLSTLGVRQMSPEQMVECIHPRACLRPVTSYNDRVVHTLHLVDKNGNDLCQVGKYELCPNPAPKPSFFRSFTGERTPPFIEVIEYETVEEALAKCEAKYRKRISCAVEKLEVKYDCHGDITLSSFSFYIYKTPKVFNSFAEFVTTTVANARANVKKEFDF